MCILSGRYEPSTSLVVPIRPLAKKDRGEGALGSGSIEVGDDLLELGPGPGLSTDLLRLKAQHLTAIELDTNLARQLAARLRGSNVEVVTGDATAMPFPDCQFSASTCFTMLHHVPSVELQNRLFAEVRRVLAPGGVFVGTDSRSSLRMKVFHWFDTMVIVDPLLFPDRLLEAGFTDPQIEIGQGAFRFRAT